MSYLNKLLIFTGIVLTFFMLLTIFGFNTPKKELPIEAKKATVCIVSNDSKVIKSYIEVFCNKGYYIQSLVSQNVAIARSGGVNAESHMMGDMILVLTKK